MKGYPQISIIPNIHAIVINKNSEQCAFRP